MADTPTRKTGSASVVSAGSSSACSVALSARQAVIPATVTHFNKLNGDFRLLDFMRPLFTPAGVRSYTVRRFCFRNGCTEYELISPNGKRSCVSND